MYVIIHNTPCNNPGNKLTNSLFMVVINYHQLSSIIINYYQLLFTFKSIIAKLTLSSFDYFPIFEFVMIIMNVQISMNAFFFHIF